VLISTQGNLAKFREPSARRGVHWGMLTGTAISSYTVVDAYGVKALGIHPVVLDWCSNVVRVIVLAPWVVANRHLLRSRMRKRWGLAIAVGLLAPLSYILVLLALQIGAPLSLAAPAREMSMMVGALRSEEHTSELQSRENLVCRLLLEKKKQYSYNSDFINKYRNFHFLLMVTSLICNNTFIFYIAINNFDGEWITASHRKFTDIALHIS